MTGVPEAVGLVLHQHRPQAAALAKQLVGELRRRGVEVRMPSADAQISGLAELGCADDRFGPGLALALSLGGDGTMLRTVELVADADVPVLGVNVGHLGYLTAVAPEELDGLLERALAGDFQVEERMTLAIDVARPGDAAPQRFVALNEAVLEKSSSGHTVRLGVSFNDDLFSNYVADGLIVATPTGSTAYAFSARGPIVSPLLRALVVVPVSPHMLFDRSLVLDPSETIQVDVLDGRPAMLFVDGRDAGLLPEGSVVRCQAGAHPARLVTFARRDFHRILRAKFGLGTAGGPATGFPAGGAGDEPDSEDDESGSAGLAGPAGGGAGGC